MYARYYSFLPFQAILSTPLLPQTAFFDPSRYDIKRGKNKRGARVPWTFQPVHGFPQWTFSLANIQITLVCCQPGPEHLVGLVRRWQTGKNGWKLSFRQKWDNILNCFNFLPIRYRLPGWSQQLLQHFYIIMVKKTKISFVSFEIYQNVVDNTHLEQHWMFFVQ